MATKRELASVPSGGIDLEDLKNPKIQLAADWAEAGNELIYGHPGDLAKMLRAHHAVPHSIADLLADAITGKLKLKRKGASNRKLNLRDQKDIWSTMRFSRSRLTSTDVDGLANELGMEPAEVRAVELQFKGANLRQALATKYRVSVDTIKKIEKRKRRPG